MPRKTFTVEYCDYCYGEDESKEVEATDLIKINGREALACDKHSKPVRKMLETFESVSSPIPSATPQRPRSRRASADGEQLSYVPSEVRAWARAENEKAGKVIYPVGENARIRKSVIEAYLAAHGK